MARVGSIFFRSFPSIGRFNGVDATIARLAKSAGTHNSKNYTELLFDDEVIDFLYG